MNLDYSQFEIDTSSQYLDNEIWFYGNIDISGDFQNDSSTKNSESKKPLT